MHILILTQIIPYPPDAGPKVKTWHVLRYLAGRGHRLTLASFIRPEEEQYVPTLRGICQAVHTIPIKRSRLGDVGYLLRSYLSGRPFLIERDDLAEMHAVVKQIVETEKVDVIHADQLTMTLYGLPYGRSGKSAGEFSDSTQPALIFDAHNAVWTIVERMRHKASWYLKPVAGLEARRIKRYEGKVVREFDYTLTVTEPDRLALQEAVAFSANGVAIQHPHYYVVPIAVDTHLLQPVTRQPGSLNIMTMGTLHYPPNADGIRWFAQDVFPLVRQQIPQATLTIVGKNPPPELTRLNGSHHIEVAGYVSDLKQILAETSVLIVPLHAGGGMRVKILDTWSWGLPIVSTSIGAEGIEACDQENILIADTIETFTQSVQRVLGDPALNQSLRQNGRRWVEQKYDWRKVYAEWDKIYP